MTENHFKVVQVLMKRLAAFRRTGQCYQVARFGSKDSLLLTASAEWLAAALCVLRIRHEARLRTPFGLPQNVASFSVWSCTVTLDQFVVQFLRNGRTDARTATRKPSDSRNAFNKLFKQRCKHWISFLFWCCLFSFCFLAPLPSQSWLELQIGYRPKLRFKGFTKKFGP